MRIIGITGGIGSGKSTAARILQDYGARLILADKVAKDIVEPGMPAYREIIAYFGTEILNVRKEIDRKKLGDIVFANKDKLNKLNEITHGTVALKIKEMLGEFEKEGARLAVVEAIVPVAHGFLDLVDTVWVVLASEEVRIQRIMNRNGLTHEEARQRIQAQMSDEMYKSVASQVIYNDGSVEDLKKKIWEVYRHEEFGSA